MRIDKRFKPDLCSAKETTYFNRPELELPWLDLEGKQLIATDGHVLVVVPVEVDKDDKDGQLVSKEALEFARKATERRVPYFEVKDGTTLVQSGHVFPISDWYRNRKLPDWRPAFKPRKRGAADTVTVGLNLDLLNRVAKALGVKKVTLTISTKDPAFEAMTVRSLDEPEAGTALVMPMRY